MAAGSIPARDLKLHFSNLLRVRWITFPNRVPRVFPLGEGRKDPGRRWSRDLLKSSKFLISNPSQ